MKYYHELTEEECQELDGNLTWEELAELHPQPVWCSYPDAVCGAMGCWGLMAHEVKHEIFCSECDCYIPKCKSCNGKGKSYLDVMYEAVEVPCKDCGGKGRLIEQPDCLTV